MNPQLKSCIGSLSLHQQPAVWLGVEAYQQAERDVALLCVHVEKYRQRIVNYDYCQADSLARTSLRSERSSMALVRLNQKLNKLTVEHS